jgi:hypothetical protein
MGYILCHVQSIRCLHVVFRAKDAYSKTVNSVTLLRISHYFADHVQSRAENLLNVRKFSLVA